MSTYYNDYNFSKHCVNGKYTKWFLVYLYLRDNGPSSKRDIVKAVWPDVEVDPRTLKGWCSNTFAQMNDHGPVSYDSDNKVWYAETHFVQCDIDYPNITFDEAMRHNKTYVEYDNLSRVTYQPETKENTTDAEVSEASTQINYNRGPRFAYPTLNESYDDFMCTLYDTANEMGKREIKTLQSLIAFARLDLESRLGVIGADNAQAINHVYDLFSEHVDKLAKHLGV